MASKKFIMRKPISKEQALKELGFTYDSKPKMSSFAKKIDSPLARYSSNGQLSCALCNITIKGDAWKAHTNGKMHREKVTNVKNNKESPSNMRQKAEDMLRDLKKLRALEEKKREEEEKKKSLERNATKSILKGSSSKSKSVSSQEKTPHTTIIQDKKHKKGPPKPDPAVKRQLPQDFFENEPKKGVKVQIATTSEKKGTKEKPVAPSYEKALAFNAQQRLLPENTDEDDLEEGVDTSDLPEGFFDDPKLDAKARKVEYKDPKEEEWKSFMKSIEAEENVSAAIQEEDQEAATVERHIDEIDEQISHWERVLDMEKRKEVLAAKEKSESKEEKEEDSSSDDEADFDEFLDWRSKGAWK